jgi:hypothetical protein
MLAEAHRQAAEDIEKTILCAGHFLRLSQHESGFPS